ncbi:hypothetical protein HPP92_008111 [Vanilla planifolia]|uniref:Uncharacterized protein n=1 Tax=Vanilla planifolia TaxID=51239 RepID=A0A835RBB3_VANPL|nr:hypothetical protein HPP92_008111 [Vanilla planifolia]
MEDQGITELLVGARGSNSKARDSASLKRVDLSSVDAASIYSAGWWKERLMRSNCGEWEAFGWHDSPARRNPFSVTQKSVRAPLLGNYLNENGGSLWGSSFSLSERILFRHFISQKMIRIERLFGLGHLKVEVMRTQDEDRPLRVPPMKVAK